MSKCVQCSEEQRTNKHLLQLQYLSLTYGSTNMINELSLPRKYTTTHQDFPIKLFLSVGHEYDSCLIANDPDKERVTGEWLKKDNKYEIHLEALVSDAQHPNAEERNKEFCNYMSIVLETIGFAETHLLLSHPKLAATRIYIHFKSNDPAYDRVEYWHRLGYWAQKCIKADEIPEKPKKSKKHDDCGCSKKPKKHYERRPPQMCPSCK
jgi:hypothetical protein